MHEMTVKGHIYEKCNFGPARNKTAKRPPMGQIFVGWIIGWTIYLSFYKNKDAKVLTHLRQTLQISKKWFPKHGDLSFVKIYKNSLEMSCFVKQRETQLSTKDANVSRLKVMFLCLLEFWCLKLLQIKQILIIKRSFRNVYVFKDFGNL